MDVNAAYDAKQQKASGLKTLTPKQMLQRFPIALAQIKASNNSESIKGEWEDCLFFVSIKRNY